MTLKSEMLKDIFAAENNENEITESITYNIFPSSIEQKTQTHLMFIRYI
mgnify:CR=1 FL=1